MSPEVLPNFTYTKIVQSGDLLEIYDYEKEPSKKRFTNTAMCGRCATVQYLARAKNIKQYRSLLCKKCLDKKRYKKPRKKRNVVRARNQFRRMVRASLALGAPVLATLTMVSITDLTTAYKCLSKFTRNLRKSFGPDIAWVGVPEFQKRGAVHFHCLIWGLPNDTVKNERITRDIQAFWGRGWVDILVSDGSPKISSYMAKYMSKSMYDDRLGSKKSYTASRNALRPVLINSRTSIAYVEEEYPEIRGVDSVDVQCEEDMVYKTEWLGRCHYRKLIVVKKL